VTGRQDEQAGLAACHVASGLSSGAQNVYYLCMGTKTISLREEAYERLRRAKKGSAESFSDVVMRATWPEVAVTAAGFLSLVRERGALYQTAELDRVDEVSAADAPPADKWPAG